MDRSKTVDLYDMVVVAANYGVIPPYILAADIDGSGSVDLLDLVIVARNYGFDSSP